MFRRRRGPAGEPDPAADDPLADEPETDETESPAEPAAGVAGRPAGPWDVTDAPDPEGLIDLGGVRVRPLPGIDVRLDLAEQQQVMAVTLVDGHSTVQIAAFAAPKSSGLWDEVRAEIAASISGSGGSVETADGPFGVELRARLRVQPPGSQQPVLQPARFVGVDGPRWFVRGLFAGPAATDPAQARRLEDAFRAVVVVRGGDAMAPRDQIPLRPPREMLGADQPAGPAEDPLNPFRRGPEITEVR